MIDINSISFEIGGQKILNCVSFTVLQNACAALLGPNGSGKSTLIDIITGAINPSEGNVKINGKNFKDIKESAGVLFENPPMFYYSKVNEIIFYMCTIYGISYHDIQQLVKLLRIDEMLNKLIRVLSKGERKKVGLLITLMHHPDILILDDLVQAWIRFSEMNYGASLILVVNYPFTTHIWEEAEKYADNIIFISNGNILCFDTPGNLLSSKYTGFSHKITIPKNGHLSASLEQMPYIEDENSIHILSSTPERVIELLNKKVTNFSVSEITLMDVFMYLERRQK